MLHGEGDRVPGFVVDRYGPVAVLRTDGDGAAARVGDLAHVLGPTLESWGVSTLVHRVGGKGEKPRLDVLRGDAPPDSVTVREHGLSFVVDLKHGQKTGAFLDQRENRRRVGELAAGRRVLNLFSYAGGFSLFAARGGAKHVTSVDVAAGAHATAQQSFRASGVDPGQHAFATADVYAFLEQAKKRRETWDLVVSDPPSFAPSEKAVPRALAAYRALHRACADVLARRGVLVAASCSSHVDMSAFLTTLDDAAVARDDLRVLELRGAGPDHPTLAAFPEGRYLKCALRVTSERPLRSFRRCALRSSRGYSARASSVSDSRDSRGSEAMRPRGSNTPRSFGVTAASALRAAPCAGRSPRGGRCRSRP